MEQIVETIHARRARHETINGFIVVEENIIKDWKVDREIGAGVHGTIFQVYHSSDKKKAMPFAMKVVEFKNTEKQQSSLPEFVLEVSGHLNARSHLPENVPELFEAWVYRNRGYMVVQFMPEGSIPLISSQANFDELIALWNEFARHGILHGDYKISNIFRHNGRYMIGDWGVSICPADLKHHMIHPWLIERISIQLEERRRQGKSDLFEPVCNMMIKILHQCTDVSEFITRLVFYETLYRLHRCLETRALQDEMFRKINFNILSWLRSELLADDIPVEEISTPVFWDYYHKFVDFVRNILWIIQVEQVERAIAMRFILEVRRDYPNKDVDVKMVRSKKPVSRYVCDRVMNKMISK